MKDRANRIEFAILNRLEAWFGEIGVSTRCKERFLFYLISANPFVSEISRFHKYEIFHSKIVVVDERKLKYDKLNEYLVTKKINIRVIFS